MKTIGTTLGILLFVVVFAGGGYILFSGYKHLSSQWAVLNNDWRAGLAVFSTVLIVCTLFVSSSIRSSSRKHSLASNGKVIAYNDFISWYSELKNHNPEIQNTSSFREIRNQIMLWGNDHVVKQMNLLYETLNNSKENMEQIISKADHVYLEIRRELGYRSLRVDRSIV